MKIALTCQCGKQLSVPPEHAGKKGKCPQCGNVLRIPNGAPAAPPIVTRSAPPKVAATPSASLTVVDKWKPPANSLFNMGLWSFNIRSPKEAHWLLKQTAILVYVSAAGALLVAVLLFKESRLTPVGFLFDAVLAGALAFFVQKRQSTLAAVILLALALINTGFSLANGGHQPNIVIAILGMILSFRAIQATRYLKSLAA